MLDRRAALALPFLLLGCAGANREDTLDRMLRYSAEQAAPKSETVHTFALVARRGEADHGFRVILHADKCYVVLAVADGTVTDVNLQVFDPIGAVAAKTNAEAPKLELCAKRSGPYRVKLHVTGRGRVRAGVYERRL